MTAAVKGTGDVTVRVPPTFRFGDVNPVNGRRYLSSRYRQLPCWVQDVVHDEVGVTPARWDALVEKGEAASAVGPWTSYSLAGFHRAVRGRPVGALVGAGCGRCGGVGGYVQGWAAGPGGSAGRVVACPCGGA